MKTLFTIFLSFVLINLYGQSNFDFKTISSKNKIIEIRYDGRPAAIADSDVSKNIVFVQNDEYTFWIKNINFGNTIALSY